MEIATVAFCKFVEEWTRDKIWWEKIDGEVKIFFWIIKILVAFWQFLIILNDLKSLKN